MLQPTIRTIATILVWALVSHTLWCQNDAPSLSDSDGTILEMNDADDAGQSGVLRDEPEEIPPGDTLPAEGDADPIAPRIQSTADSASDHQEFAVETITERFPNGKTKIERQVTQDKDQNYIEHGSWQEFDADGNELAGGTYQLGKRDGEWFRWYDTAESDLFSKAPFNQFTGPFKSLATLQAGVLNGVWSIADSEDRKVCQWQFANGRRHGTSTWFYVTGVPMREIHYHNGELHGKLTEWDPNRQPVTEVEYINGRRHEKVSTKFEDGQKKSEGMVLRARHSLQKPDDWWPAQVARYSKEGKDEKHGRWSLWYSGGQQKMEGEYQFDEPSGQFTWWHENGQKSLEALYSAGKKDGVWTWWHPNGQKSIQGAYLDGSPSGRWTWWHETGKVAQRIDYSAAASQNRTPMQSSDAAWKNAHPNR